ncbi:PREDICTED: ribulose bisphosphate carboxylase small chain, chloroplastic-like [Nelumbo nucifera]|uniref:Ribulose bisphosphate carboxylase small subunit, chloroplastic n=1 Tax=Nelumbo nucifera TaxID=4432 RepID=A0A1U8AAL5_NELNU|nr:PREDICTED: ribulose bisphosphate carboxylase small chain, chloroplastic-like [Nelumbo nucifera]
MASSMFSSTAVANIGRATPAQASMVAPFTGLKSASAFPVTRKANNDITSLPLPSNGGRVQCMQVWPPTGKKKFETLSYLPPLSPESLAKEVDYLLRMGWIPCLEFELEHGFVYRENNRSPGYYDGRYWTMWKLPMFGCTDSSQVLAELEEAKKAYPNAFIRIIGFDNKRQVQCISFIAYKPPGY